MQNSRKLFLYDFFFAVLSVIFIVTLYSSVYNVLFNKISGTADNLTSSGTADPAYIQEQLIKFGFYAGEITGRYDTETSEAVRRFQLYLGFEGSGRVDEATAEALSAGAYDAFSEYDVYLLARLIQAESDSDDWFEMITIGAEAVRRLGSTEHPDTLAGVIFEYGAYDSAADGSIWNEPSDKAVRAARDAMRGMLN